MNHQFVVFSHDDRHEEKQKLVQTSQDKVFAIRSEQVEVTFLGMNIVCQDPVEKSNQQGRVREWIKLFHMTEDLQCFPVLLLQEWDGGRFKFTKCHEVVIGYGDFNGRWTPRFEKPTIELF